MKYQLRMSQTNGVRRNGTTFSELKSIFTDNITTRLIFEPIYCCKIDDNVLDVKNKLNEMDFDTAGVHNENGEFVGYVLRNKLTDIPIKNSLLPVDLSNIISDSTPLVELFTIFTKNEFCFIVQSNKVTGIVTRADINKPIVRIYLFGIISLLELHLNFWIRKIYKNDD
jgi:predicted transcriptional regulator